MYVYKREREREREREKQEAGHLKVLPEHIFYFKMELISITCFFATQTYNNKE